MHKHMQEQEVETENRNRFPTWLAPLALCAGARVANSSTSASWKIASLWLRLFESREAVGRRAFTVVVNAVCSPISSGRHEVL